ncbi:hypothetical protein ACFQ4C_09440 [Larkinella insperata]|uniref:Outer membrane protein beta-barrel domain-containing protein n=1 Tax=Larkinella insperata TaxID=332158 RepID=A0ABW3Q325_9BACT|nr:hypothetical protein [Larkinella insperata]
MKTFSYPRFFYTVLLLIFLSSASVWAQDGGRNKAVYAEALGSGITLSLNYDFRFKPTQDGLGMRIGVGGGSFSDTNSDAKAGIVTMPVLVDYLVGQRRVAFEAGAGLTLVYINVSGTDAVSGELLSGKGFGFMGTFNTGLRLQPVRNGVVFRLNWSPAISNAGFQANWLGLSLGYAFK